MSIYNILENIELPFVTLYCIFINVLLWTTFVQYYYPFTIFIALIIIKQFNIFTNS